jgi:hypothetical protein
VKCLDNSKDKDEKVEGVFGAQREIETLEIVEVETNHHVDVLVWFNVRVLAVKGKARVQTAREAAAQHQHCAYWNQLCLQLVQNGQQT